MAVMGICKLCLNYRALQKSHLLGRALFALIRATENADPVIMTPQIVLATSKQLWAHLLCFDCEQRFRALGEDYAMRMVQRETESEFRLRNMLNLAIPLRQEGPLMVFSGLGVGIDVEKLAYFALSIAWRTAVRKWSTLPPQTSSISLGQFEAPIRNYLLGESAFPSGVNVVVTVATDAISRTTVFGASQTRDIGFTSFSILTRGIWFDISTGAEVPPEVQRRCCITSVKRLIFMANCERRTVEAAGRATRNARIAHNTRARYGSKMV